MKTRIFIIIVVLSIVYGCKQNTKPQQIEENKVEEKEQSYPKKDTIVDKRAYYQTKMKEKNISFSIYEPCDENAIYDTIHERGVAYIESKKINGSHATIKFKFKDACCQEFLGDYKVENDTLKFEFEQVNEEMCACICWYRYKLEIDNVKENFSEIEIKQTFSN